MPKNRGVGRAVRNLPRQRPRKSGCKFVILVFAGKATVAAWAVKQGVEAMV